MVRNEDFALKLSELYFWSRHQLFDLLSNKLFFLNVLIDGFSFPFLYNKLLQTSQLKTTNTYYLTVSAGQASGHGLARYSTECPRKYWSWWSGLQAHLRPDQARIYTHSDRYQNSVHYSFTIENFRFLLTVGQRPLSSPRNHLQLFAMWHPQCGV